MGERWAAHVDILGFGEKWDETSMEPFRGLGALMSGILRIGRKVYWEPPDRLFAHQFGDAFLITSDFHEESLNRAAVVVVALMRHVLASGALARATIAEGQLSDIVGCYPEDVRDYSGDSSVPCGAGLMTIFPVMGTALIRAVAIDKKCPRGPLVLLEGENESRVTNFPIKRTETGLLSLDWLNGEEAELKAVQTRADLLIQDQDKRVATLKRYMAANPGVGQRSRDAVTQLLGVHGI